MYKKLRNFNIFLIFFCIICSNCSIYAADIWGDADGDGKITANDSVIVLQYTLNGRWLQSTDKNRCDVNADGRVDAADAAAILQKALLSTFKFEAEAKNPDDRENPNDPDKHSGKLVIADSFENIFLTSGTNIFDEIRSEDVFGDEVGFNNKSGDYKVLVVGSAQDAGIYSLLSTMEISGLGNDVDIYAVFTGEDDNRSAVTEFMEDYILSGPSITYCPYDEAQKDFRKDICELLELNPNIVATPLTVMITPDDRICMIGFGTPNIISTINDIASGDLVITTTTAATTTETTTETTTATTAATTVTTTVTTTKAATVTTTEKPTEATTSSSGLPEGISADKALVVNGEVFYLGQSEDSLPSSSRIDTGFEGCLWYIYNDDYAHYTQVAVVDGTVQAIYTMSDDFKYKTLYYGADVSNYSLTMDSYYLYYIYENNTKAGVQSIVYFDENDNNRLYGMMLKSTKWRPEDIPEFSWLSTGEQAERLEGMRKEIADITNAFRDQNNLSILRTTNSKLNSAAQGHASDMATNNYFSHNSLNGTSFSDRISAAVGSFRAAGENIQSGELNAMGAVNGWINSTKHRTNLVSTSYGYIGVGFACNPNSNDETYFVQDFLG